MVRSETASAEEKFEDAISDETDGQEQLRSEKLQTGKPLQNPILYTNLNPYKNQNKCDLKVIIILIIKIKILK